MRSAFWLQKVEVPPLTISAGLRLFFLLGLFSSWPGVVGAAEFGYRTESNLKFHGVSTIRSWTCDTVPVEGTLELPLRVESRRQLLHRLEGFKPVGELRVPVNSIDCGESGFFDHNENLRRTLRGDRYPYITFDPGAVRDVNRGSDVHFTVAGDLRITDTTKRETIPLSVTVSGTRPMRVTGDFTISLREYGLDPPHLMLGLVSIYDTVRITVDLRLFPQGVTAGGGVD